MSYKRLVIWQQARHLVIRVHEVSHNMLPPYERFETGNQLRRAIVSVKANIVEGYGRRHYKMDFIRHLTYAQASLDESIDHVETLLDIESLSPLPEIARLLEEMNDLGKKLNVFIKQVQRNHKPPRS